MYIDEIIKENKIIGIAGHVHPDGDCVGSTLGLYNYIVKNYTDKEVTIYLENYNDSYKFLANTDKIKGEDDEIVYDVFFALDCGSADRIGVALNSFNKAIKKVVIDHHKTNEGFGDINIILPSKSSTSEIIADLILGNKCSLNTNQNDNEIDRIRFKDTCIGSDSCHLIDKDIAECLYLGILQDTGLFQYSSTSYDTMKIAGILMSTGIDFPKIVENTFFVKSYNENKAVGYIVYNSSLYKEGKVIVGTMTHDEFVDNDFTKQDIDSAVANLRNTRGTEIAAFIYELEEGKYKVSLRARSDFDVSKVAIKYGGGGHAKAAGFTVNATSMDDAVNKILKDLDI